MLTSVSGLVWSEGRVRGREGDGRGGWSEERVGRMRGGRGGESEERVRGESRVE